MQETRTLTLRPASSKVFFAAFAMSCAGAAFLIGSFPLQLSIVTVFLFAGPHNLAEFRYFAARMPLRWGRSRLYYSVAICGVFVLASAYLALFFSSGTWPWSEESWAALWAVWNSTFIVWVGLLIHLRGRQTRHRDLGWAIPAALAVSALAWAAPSIWGLALVYLHPLVALWFLERQIRRTKPEWLSAYHGCLLTIPLLLAAIWLSLSGRPDLSEGTDLFWRITRHAGSGVLTSVSSHVLVATHVFLESIHYFVWLLLLPLADRRAVPWRLGEVPLFAKKGGFPRAFAVLLGCGLGVVLLLWAGFLFDYSTTRDIYFAFAIGHVLAEFPFLIKML